MVWETEKQPRGEVMYNKPRDFSEDWHQTGGGKEANRPCRRKARAEGKNLEETHELQLVEQTIFY